MQQFDDWKKIVKAKVCVEHLVLEILVLILIKEVP